MENSRRCDAWIVNDHRASYARHIRNKKHIQNEKQRLRLYQNGYLKNLLKTKIGKQIILKY